MYRFAPYRGRTAQAAHGSGHQNEDGAANNRHPDVGAAAAAASYPRQGIDSDEDTEDTVARSVWHDLATQEDHRPRSNHHGSASSPKARNTRTVAPDDSSEDRKPAPKASSPNEVPPPYSLKYAIDNEVFRTRAREHMDSALEKLNEAREKTGATIKQVEELTATLPALKASIEEYLELATETAEDLVDELLEDSTAWNSHYKLLEGYYNEHGTTKLPWKPEWKRDNPALSKLPSWLIQQRREYRATRDGTAGTMAMEPYKILALERLDIVWEPHAADWHQRYKDLKRYKEEHGNCLVPILNQEGDTSSYSSPKFKYNSLGVWCKRQRLQYRAFNMGDSPKVKGMNQERIDKLNELDFEWVEPSKFESDESFAAHIESLKQFKNKHGHFKVTPKKDEALALWLKAVLAKFKRFEKVQEDSGLGAHQYETIKKLNVLEQSTIEAVFDLRMGEFVQFVKAFGHGNVPLEYGTSPELGPFVSRQRQQWKKFKAGKKSSMTSEREQQMKDAGFEFEMTKERRRSTKLGKSEVTTWDDFLALYTEFQKDFAKGFAKARGAKQLDQSKDAGGSTVEELGNSTTNGESSSPSASHPGTGGSTNTPGNEDTSQVPKKMSFEDTSPRLSTKRGKALLWAEEQRVQYARKLWGKESTLTQEQIDKLNNIEFDWKLASSPSVGWDEMFARLLAHRLKTGSFDVFGAKKELKDWVSLQIAERAKFESGVPCQITKEQIQKLDRAGFPWGPKVARNASSRTWEEFYSELLIQRIKHGSFDFPNDQMDLKVWMEVQRRVKVKFEHEQLKRSAILEHRISQLSAIGFPWEPSNDRIGRRQKPRSYAMPINDLVYASTGQGPLLKEIVESSDLMWASKGPDMVSPSDDPSRAKGDLTTEALRIMQELKEKSEIERVSPFAIGWQKQALDRARGVAASSAMKQQQEADERSRSVASPSTVTWRREGIGRSIGAGKLASVEDGNNDIEEHVERQKNPPAEEDFGALLASTESRYLTNHHRKRKAVDISHEGSSNKREGTLSGKANSIPTPKPTENFAELLEAQEKKRLVDKWRRSC